MLLTWAKLASLYYCLYLWAWGVEERCACVFQSHQTFKCRAIKQDKTISQTYNDVETWAISRDQNIIDTWLGLINNHQNNLATAQQHYDYLRFMTGIFPLIITTDRFKKNLIQASCTDRWDKESENEIQKDIYSSCEAVSVHSPADSTWQRQC